MEEFQSQIKNKFYPPREKNARKYDHGLVIVIGGSKFYTGSPALSAMAALRSGADVAQIIAPKRAADIAASFGPDLITFSLSGDHLSMDNLADLLALTRSGKDVSRGKAAVVIGGGIGRDEETKEVVREYIKEAGLPIVVDADAIYAFEEQKHLARECAEKNGQILFTPHLYEFYVLTGKDVRTLTGDERGFLAREAAQELSSTILLKGEVDVISNGRETRENKIEVPHLTAGGTGDVLAGIAGTLLARQFSPLDAGEGSAMINSLAGKLAAQEKGESLIATDVIEKLSSVIN